MDDSHSIWRRVFLIPFDVVIPDGEQDPELAAKLEAEAEGVLAWAVCGCRMYQEQGLAPPEAVRTATREYREAEDLFGVWIDEAVELKPDAWTSTADLVEAYNLWAKAHAAETMRAEALSQRLRARELQGVEPERNNSRRGWRGIKLVQQGETA